MTRSATISRQTSETSIQLTWHLDDSSESSIVSGIGFLDHMLTALAKHSGTRIELACEGDLHIDGHHTTEDIGIALGLALREALGDRRGIHRFGHMAVPLDEALVQATVDISGRGYLVNTVEPPAPMIGDWDTELLTEFFQAFADNARCCIHLHQVCGRNSHHLVEASFKSFARALRQAIALDGSDNLPQHQGNASVTWASNGW